MGRQASAVTALVGRINTRLDAWQETIPAAGQVITAFRKQVNHHGECRGGKCVRCGNLAPCGTLVETARDLGVSA